LGSLRRVYTWADTTLFADAPEFIPHDSPLPASHHYIGPILWSPEIAKPGWWDSLDDNGDCVYVSLGSTGQVNALRAVLDGLAELPVTVMLATADRVPIARIPSNVRAAPFLPGAAAAKRAALVVCNGGSATTYQALAVGKPVLGIPSNIDQHLTMEATVRAGAGLTVRAELATASRIRDAVTQLLSDARFPANARKVAAWFSRHDAPQTFRRIVAEICLAPSVAEPVCPAKRGSC
jgi:UDP:flavonoid glycosyltransferase YjiC (YdhE family)